MLKILRASAVSEEKISLSNSFDNSVKRLEEEVTINDNSLNRRDLKEPQGGMSQKTKIIPVSLVRISTEFWKAKVPTYGIRNVSKLQS